MSNISSTTITDMQSGVANFRVSAEHVDEATGAKETYHYNTDWHKNLGYYKKIPELKKAIDALAMWTAGKGWTADARTTALLEAMPGWGEDSFDTILQNMITVKKVNGDSYAEIIREGDLTINLKPLNPFYIRHVVDPKGLIIRYDELNKSGDAIRKIQPEDMFHLCNDRIANEIHGTSVIDACKWVIDARNEAMEDWRRVLHRSTVRVLFVDAQDTSKMSTLKTQYKDAINKGELLILPKIEGGEQFQDLQAPPIQVFLDWIRYLENFFYQAVGVPKIILGGSQEFTEASSKIGYLTFEQVYMTEQRILEQDLFNQLGVRITFDRPTSLKEDVVSSEAANTGQVGFQPNETRPGVGRNE